MTTFKDFLPQARRLVAKAMNHATDQDREKEALNLAYALAEIANMRLYVVRFTYK